MARAMKDSGIVWIGSIPSNWKIKPLKYSLQIGSGSTPDSKEPSYWDGEIPWITPADYKTKDVFVSEGHSFITEAGLKSCSTQLVPADSLIFSKRAPIGSVSISANPLTTNQGCLWGIPKQNVDVKYFYYLLSIYPEIFELYGAGTTFKEISATAFGNVKMPVPSFNEQKKIDHFLDIKFSEIISLSSVIQKEIETLEAYKKSLITEAVTKGLDISVPMKSSGNPWIGKIPTTWVLSKVKYVSSVVTDGAHVSPDYVDDGYEFISTVNVIDGAINFENCIHTSESSYKVFVNTGCKPRRGDVLISKDGTVGKTVIIDYDREFVIGSSLVIIRPVCNKINQRFLNYNLQAKYTQQLLQLIMHGSALKRVSVQKNSNLPLTLPPLNEQVSIADYLDDKCSEVDAIIASKKQQLETLATYKKSLIYEYVTGKKEVK